MSLAMFVTMGLTLISTPIAGALVKLNPTLFLLITGMLAAVLSLIAALNFLRHEKNSSEKTIYQDDTVRVEAHDLTLTQPVLPDGHSPLKEDAVERSIFTQDWQ